MLAQRLLVLGIQGGGLFPLSSQARRAFALFSLSRIFAECVTTICFLLNELFLGGFSGLLWAPHVSASLLHLVITLMTRCNILAWWVGFESSLLFCLFLSFQGLVNICEYRMFLRVRAG